LDDDTWEFYGYVRFIDENNNTVLQFKINNPNNLRNDLDIFGMGGEKFFHLGSSSHSTQIHLLVFFFPTQLHIIAKMDGLEGTTRDDGNGSVDHSLNYKSAAGELDIAKLSATKTMVVGMPKIVCANITNAYFNPRWRKPSRVDPSEPCILQFNGPTMRLGDRVFVYMVRS